jgi:hypothetical protein
VYPADLQAHGFGRCDEIIGQIPLDIMIEKEVKDVACLLRNSWKLI